MSELSSASAVTTVRPWSLRNRALAFGILTVAAFMLFTGAALEQSFSTTVMAASEERLQSRVFLIMGRAELDEAGTPVVTEPLPEPDLELPDSGALAAITDIAGTMYWSSASSLGNFPVLPATNQPGSIQLTETILDDGEVLRSLSYPVLWEYGDDEETILVFHAAESADRVTDEIAGFRNRLQLWLGGAAICLLLLQLLMLKWLMQPLRQISHELKQVETGKHGELELDYPAELQPLVNNLNALLILNRQRLQRYRNSIADLAHSLKTPLAIIRAGSEQQLDKQAVAEQLERVEASIEYQLQKAATVGRSPLAAPVDLHHAVQRIFNSLSKVYQYKSLQFENRVPPGIRFYGDVDDLLEVLGNLGDNACKWAAGRVEFSAAYTGNPERPTLCLCIDDDGPGIAPELRQQVLLRGVRADTRVPGQGLGLAIVRETVTELYQGSIEIDKSPLGGARVRCLFP